MGQAGEGNLVFPKAKHCPDLSRSFFDRSSTCLVTRRQH
jgi:hypothetical protein